MPCNSDYMEPLAWEVGMSHVACLLDELDGKPFNKNHWHGFHPTVYGKGYDKARRDKMTATLCERLKRTDVSKHSLEMQMWWRDHQAADCAREAKEQA